ncbi:MAG TPA: hypothetical protein VHK69_00480 [Chitinophagaceae bacterium]|jgi:hypothetical protein|nr:hypothetical protein [Chitinophagaceae bacterium]
MMKYYCTGLLFLLLLGSCGEEPSTRQSDNSVRAIDPNGAVTDTESVFRDSIGSDTAQGLTH